MSTEQTNDLEMQAFCSGVGELVLWASAIDAQLNKAVIRACVLTETQMLEPIVAELDARIKVGILKASSKHIAATDWTDAIRSWVNKVENVNGYRNIVAHHQVKIIDGQLVLYSVQAQKLLKSIRESSPLPAKNIDDIKQWIEYAKDTYEKGGVVVCNLDRFVEEHANQKEE